MKKQEGGGSRISLLETLLEEDDALAERLAIERGVNGHILAVAGAQRGGFDIADFANEARAFVPDVSLGTVVAIRAEGEALRLPIDLLNRARAAVPGRRHRRRIVDKPKG